jgi:hypothetical protein
MGSKNLSPNDSAYKSKNQIFGWNFFKIILKGVTAKLNKIALYGVLADLKKIDFCLQMNYLSNKKKQFVLIFFYGRVIEKIVLCR